MYFKVYIKHQMRCLLLAIYALFVADYAKNYLSNPVLQTLLLVLQQRDDHGTLDSMLRALSINMEMFEIDPETG